MFLPITTPAETTWTSENLHYTLTYGWWHIPASTDEDDESWESSTSDVFVLHSRTHDHEYHCPIYITADRLWEVLLDCIQQCETAFTRLSSS